MDGEFGTAYARTLARDLVVDRLGDRTAEQALAAGHTPRSVWGGGVRGHAGAGRAPLGCGGTRSASQPLVAHDT